MGKIGKASAVAGGRPASRRKKHYLHTATFLVGFVRNIAYLRSESKTRVHSMFLRGMWSWAVAVA